MKNKALIFSLFILFFINACVFTPQIKRNNKLNTQELVRKSKTTIVNYASAEKLALLKSKFQDDDLSIRIFGDSHMAADFFSRQLRRLLLSVNAIGFSYPLQPKYQNNLMLDYETKGFELFNSKNDNTQNYAMGGVIAKASQNNAFIVLKSNLKEQNFNLGIVFQVQNQEQAFIITDSKNTTFTLKSPVANKLVYKELKNLAFPVHIKALQKGVILAGYFITQEENNKILDTIGINGARSDLWLQWNQLAFEQELKLLKSDFILLAYGSNDVLYGVFNKDKFKKNYKALIKKLQIINPNSSIMLISPPTVTQKKAQNYELAPQFEAVKKALYELAKEEKLLLFDMHEFIIQSGGKDLWIEQGLSRQDVHLSAKGYELMADKLYEDLKRLLNLNQKALN